MLTFGDVKQDRGIMRIAGFAPDSLDFAQLVNASTRMFMRRGDFPGTLQPIYVCMRGGCVVWPRYVQTVRALSPCNANVKAENMWGSFLPRDKGAPWRQGLRWTTGRDCSAAMINQGRSSVYQDIQGDGRYLRAYNRFNLDNGKTMLVFGTDNNGQPLTHFDVTSNAWYPGIQLVFGAPYVQSTIFVRSIDYVLLPDIQGPINFYAYYAAGDVLEDLAQYDPGDTRPSFERTRIQLPGYAGTGGVGVSPGGCQSQTCCRSGVNALVKLRFFPVRYDTDLIPIDNLDALKIMIQAQRFGEAGDIENKRLFQADAINELNNQLRDESPDDQFVAANEVFADRSFQNHCF
jgi:hypothetical protein